jgi:hypothetical protein
MTTIDRRGLQRRLGTGLEAAGRPARLLPDLYRPPPVDPRPLLRHAPAPPPPPRQEDLHRGHGPLRLPQEGGGIGGQRALSFLGYYFYFFSLFLYFKNIDFGVVSLFGRQQSACCCPSRRVLFYSWGKSNLLASRCLWGCKALFFPVLVDLYTSRARRRRRPASPRRAAGGLYSK